MYLLGIFRTPIISITFVIGFNLHWQDFLHKKYRPQTDTSDHCKISFSSEKIFLLFQNLNILLLNIIMALRYSTMFVVAVLVVVIATMVQAQYGNMGGGSGGYGNTGTGGGYGSTGESDDCINRLSKEDGIVAKNF
uniref:Uncharacterized protein n=1 Tax=Cacopsylla melanoneura TaxID=428564 RepID=A0A8D8YLI2_9HEMI